MYYQTSTATCNDLSPLWLKSISKRMIHCSRSGRKIRKDAIKDAIFTKPECWMYEKEWRLALTLPFGSETAFAAGISTSDYYAVIPREWLKEVTFGLRLEKEYCEKIKRISIDNGYSTTEFKKAQMAYGEFKIIIEPY